MNNRLRIIYQKLKKIKAGAFFITSAGNISYLTGLLSRDSFLVISEKTNYYLTDFRYTEEAKSLLKNRFRIMEVSKPIPEVLGQICRKMRCKKLGYEEKSISAATFAKLKETLGADRIELVPVEGVIETLRMIKRADELEKIRRATAITVEALKFAKTLIKTGIKEIEVAAEIERFIRYKGARTSAFEIIVASGPNSSRPHHITSQRRIKPGETVLVDVGVDYNGYKSDLTRVFFSGRISSITRRIYGIVREAQNKAIKAIKPGVLIHKIDAAARQYITRKGYGGFFGHALGHGIGLEVHEAPQISSKETNTLKENMVFTVEPAIYLAGRFGIRVEDMVLVNRKGCEVLSGSLNQ